MNGPRRRSPGRTAAKVLAVLAAVAAFLTVEFTPWMALGLATLLPTDGAQVAAGLVLPAAVAVCGLVAARHRTTRWPQPLAAVFGGLAVTMLLIAPPVGRGGGGTLPVYVVPALVFTVYGTYLVMLLVGWLAVRRSDRRWAAALEAARRRRKRWARNGAGGQLPSAVPVPEVPDPPRRRPSWVTVVLAGLLPAAFLAVTVPVGLAADAHPSPPAPTSTW